MNCKTNEIAAVLLHHLIRKFFSICHPFSRLYCAVLSLARMSFGFSPSDIVALVNITSKAYRGWKHACGEYSEITGSLDSLLIVLGRINKEAAKPGSVLSRNRCDQNDLKDILSNSEPTVSELHAIIIRYKSLGSSREKNWDRLRLGVKNLEPLRSQLTQHIAAIAAYLDTVGLGALGRIENGLNAIPDRIQQTIDGLAAEIRAGRREGTIMTTYSDDEKDVWRQFRRELIGEGMRSSFVHKYKPLIRKYLKELAERGELEELPPDCDGLDEGIVLNSTMSNRTCSMERSLDPPLEPAVCTACTADGEHENAMPSLNSSAGTKVSSVQSDEQADSGHFDSIAKSTDGTMADPGDMNIARTDHSDDEALAKTNFDVGSGQQASEARVLQQQALRLHTTQSPEEVASQSSSDDAPNPSRTQILANVCEIRSKQRRVSLSTRINVATEGALQSTQDQCNNVAAQNGKQSTLAEVQVNHSVFCAATVEDADDSDVEPHGEAAIREGPLLEYVNPTCDAVKESRTERMPSHKTDTSGVLHNKEKRAHEHTLSEKDLKNILPDEKVSKQYPPRPTSIASASKITHSLLEGISLLPPPSSDFASDGGQSDYFDGLWDRRNQSLYESLLEAKATAFESGEGVVGVAGGTSTAALDCGFNRWGSPSGRCSPVSADTTSTYKPQLHTAYGKTAIVNNVDPLRPGRLVEDDDGMNYTHGPIWMPGVDGFILPLRTAAPAPEPQGFRVSLPEEQIFDYAEEHAMYARPEKTAENRPTRRTDYVPIYRSCNTGISDPLYAHDDDPRSYHDGCLGMEQNSRLGEPRQDIDFLSRCRALSVCRDLHGFCEHDSDDWQDSYADSMVKVQDWFEYQRGCVDRAKAKASFVLA